ncbi:alpha/beta hydrolase [Actinoplanes sp. TBRC 11911]|uniref:alpha/beta fold hydrolase n=1 Tax=Actinoplanes sp. TBRC 11911 TaxID=2729386 RepID=UPI00145EADB3|nr:alpha/beta hydrolase [Actinoplanes sp. TBRC 11911]NMO50093.1 alpha/beta hydrolase [Actinoplanes sp. TBRC 11911]
MTTHRIPGGGETELYVEEAGPVGAQAVVFMHGLSQCGMAWDAQLRSDLADRFRLVTLDLRGHGRSARPPDGYGDSDRWADDVNAVLAELDLERPILCGWSYGGIVIGDYLRSYGAGALGGVVLVAATSRMGDSAMRFLGPEFAGCLPGLLATDVAESMRAVESFVRLCREREPGPDEFYRVLGYTAVVPPAVREALLSRTIDHDDLYADLDLPVLIVHGTLDRVILPAMSEHLAALIPNATASYYEGVGHTPFREDATRFNEELRAFAAKI